MSHDTSEPATHGAGGNPDAPRRVGFFTRITNATTLTRDGLREFGRILDVLRAPMIVSLLGVLIFGFPGQIYEIYRLYAEDFTLNNGFVYDNLRFAVFMAMLYFTCYVIWYVGRLLTIIHPVTREVLQEETTNGRIARWAPRIMGAAPAFAAAFGMARAELLRDGGQQTPELYGAAAVAFLIGYVRIWSSARRTKGDLSAYKSLERAGWDPRLRIALAVIMLGVIGYMLTQPIALTQTVGSLSIIAFFMVALVFGWAQLTYLYDRFAIPALTIMIGMLVVWSFLDLNDNHFVRELPPDPDEAALQQAREAAQVYGPRPPLTAKNAFDNWLETRGDREAYKKAGKPYPVYVIAAQGGGLYAAYQSALFMAKLQDACPTFAQHVFAISGVSGGAVGAATFTALAKEHAQNQKVESVEEPCGAAPTDVYGGKVSFVDLTQQLLRQDFLSPVVSGLLFGDFTARFSPVAIPMFDRARALESALESSWDQAHRAVGLAPSGNRLEDGILGYWNEDGAAPALFLNATEAETGRRMVFSPIEKVNDTLRTYASAVEPRADGTIPDLRLSTASIVSARFPFITPAASLRLKRSASDAAAGLGFPKLRLVDGGYYENLGLETAVDVIRAASPTRIRRPGIARRNFSSRATRLNEQRAYRREALRSFRTDVDLRVIVFDLTQDRFRPAQYSFGEALTPIKALLNTRISRAELAQERAREQFQAPCRYILVGGADVPGVDESDEEQITQLCKPGDIKDSRVWSVSLNDFEYDFQLGWLLSRDTLRRIEDQLGDPAGVGCAPQTLDTPEEVAGITEATAEASTDAQLRMARLLGFTDGISITEDPYTVEQTTDALAIHNACIGSFVLDQLRVGSAQPGRPGILERLQRDEPTGEAAPTEPASGGAPG